MDGQPIFTITQERVKHEHTNGRECHHVYLWRHWEDSTHANPTYIGDLYRQDGKHAVCQSWYQNEHLRALCEPIMLKVLNKEL